MLIMFLVSNSSGESYKAIVTALNLQKRVHGVARALKRMGGGGG